MIPYEESAWYCTATFSSVNGECLSRAKKLVPLGRVQAPFSLSTEILLHAQLLTSSRSQMTPISLSISNSQGHYLQVCTE
mmetsp:Transcript_15584/g.28585  ORF Transcript_15584/g.28585 Transcript_15584/m.28585 type:complete len:80 (-) Transcript_15584:834-1073(-)